MTEQLTTIPVEYRTWHIGQPPRRIKLDIGGWAGENTWKKPQAWHCKPFTDASTYAMELIYPWETTCEVTCDDKGKCKFHGDFSKEKPQGSEESWEPFGAFAPWHFGFVSMIDIKTQPGYGLMVQPHPRVYSDRNGTTPVAVPGILEMDWWPEIFFIVFKAPLPGFKLIFKKDDPVASFMVVPKNIKYDITEMPAETKDVRESRQSKLEQSWNHMCTRVFYCEDGQEFFDNKYKVLSNIAKRDGLEAVNACMDDPTKLPHWNKNPTVVDHRPEEKRVCKHNPWKEEEKEVKKEVYEYQEPVLPKDFWKDVPAAEEDQDIMEEGLGELEDVLNNTEDFTKLTDDEMNSIITAFKMQKRKVRMERSVKLKEQCQPSKLYDKVATPLEPVKKMAQPKPKNDNDDLFLGHRMEKLI